MKKIKLILMLAICLTVGSFCVIVYGQNLQMPDNEVEVYILLNNHEENISLNRAADYLVCDATGKVDVNKLYKDYTSSFYSDPIVQGEEKVLPYILNNEQVVTAVEKKLTEAGYTFVEGQEQIVYPFEINYQKDTGHLHIDYRVNYQAIYYNVVYDFNDNGSTGNKRFENLLFDADTPTVDSPHRSGYVFKGWEPSVIDKIRGNAYYVAQWEEEPTTSAATEETTAGETTTEEVPTEETAAGETETTTEETSVTESAQETSTEYATEETVSSTEEIETSAKVLSSTAPNTGDNTLDLILYGICFACAFSIVVVIINQRRR